MRRGVSGSLGVLVLTGIVVAGSSTAPKIDSEKIRAHVKYLASDELEGRGMNQKGGDLAADYIAAQFKSYGLKPAGEKGTYFQRVPMVAVQTLPSTTFEFVPHAGAPVELKALDDYVLEGMSDEVLAEVAEKTSVFAKLSPEQKARVIRALHRKDHVVGFLGDGINDGPALKAADVGISVDTAVDIAKESADIILLEKSLLVLEEGVLEGRKVFGNIIKYIKMGASSNFGNMFSVLGASMFLPFVPMAPIQVLVNNLLYDFSQIAIPTDNVDPEYHAASRAAGTWATSGGTCCSSAP